MSFKKATIPDSIIFSRIKRTVPQAHDQSIRQAMKMFPQDTVNAIKFAKLQYAVPDACDDIIYEAVCRFWNDMDAAYFFALEEDYAQRVEELPDRLLCQPISYPTQRIDPNVQHDKS